MRSNKFRLVAAIASVIFGMLSLAGCVQIDGACHKGASIAKSAIEDSLKQLYSGHVVAMRADVRADFEAFVRANGKVEAYQELGGSGTCYGSEGRGSVRVRRNGGTHIENWVWRQNELVGFTVDPAKPSPSL